VQVLHRHASWQIRTPLHPLHCREAIILSQPGIRVKPATTHQEIRSAQLQASSGHHHHTTDSPEAILAKYVTAISMDDFDAD